MGYKDIHGYKRNSKEPSNLVHRHRAYHHIYLKNRKKYPLPFEAYEVHHIDGDKKNNRMDNLAVLTPEEHDKAHEDMDFELAVFGKFGLLLEDFEETKEFVEKEYSVSPKKLIKDFEETIKEMIENNLSPTEEQEEAWKELLKKYREEKEEVEREVIEEEKRKKRNKKIKVYIKKGIKSIFKKKK